MVVTEYYGSEAPELEEAYLNATTAKDKPFSDLMMTMWTNFAKSG